MNHLRKENEESLELAASAGGGATLQLAYSSGVRKQTRSDTLWQAQGGSVPFLSSFPVAPARAPPFLISTLFHPHSA